MNILVALGCCGAISQRKKAIEVVRDTDPRCAELEKNGYSLVGESWGARLRMDESFDFKVYLHAVELVKEQGITLRELTSDFTEPLLELELLNHSDYPETPATLHSIPTFESTQALWRDNNRIFGAIHEERLVGAIFTSRSGDKRSESWNCQVSGFQD